MYRTYEACGHSGTLIVGKVILAVKNAEWGMGDGNSTTHFAKDYALW